MSDSLYDADTTEPMTHEQLAAGFTAVCRPCDPSEEVDSGYSFGGFQSEEEPEETVFTPDPILTEIATVAAMVDAVTKAETK